MPPNFLHIGAAKAASSWLWTVCKEHPEIYVPQTPDNVNFFTVAYHRGIEWYERTYFADYAGQKAVGEFSNSYMIFEPAMARIAHDLPDVKLTMTLRNPIERTYLDWAHVHLKKKMGFDIDKGIGFPFEKLVHHHGHAFFRMYIDAGLYAQSLKRLLRYFSRDRLLVTLYDDLNTGPRRYLRDYFAFVGVDNAFVASIIDQQVNPDTAESDAAAAIDSELRSELRAVFRDDIDELQDMIGRDLAHWT